MHTFLDAKQMAKALRAALAEQQVDISHAASLELVARQFGLADWNTLSARIAAAAVDEAELPAGWYAYHDAPYPLHRLGRDPTRAGVVKIASMASSDVVGGHFATLMQSIDAEAFRGQTVQLTVELRGIDVDRGTIWMRIDPRGGGRAMRFDNLLQRRGNGALTGTFGWTERRIVLDVPADAGSIHYGPMLKGVGELHARNVRLASLPGDTVARDGYNYPRRPTGFDGTTPA